MSIQLPDFLYVTQENIDTANRASATTCPIANALRDAGLLAPSVVPDEGFIDVVVSDPQSLGDVQFSILDPNLAQKISDWDLGEIELEPFTVDLRNVDFPE